MICALFLSILGFLPRLVDQPDTFIFFGGLKMYVCMFIGDWNRNKFNLDCCKNKLKTCFIPINYHCQNNT